MTTTHEADSQAPEPQPEPAAPEPAKPPQEQRLKRELKLGNATMLGLGSILGTGVFVSLGLAAGVAGTAVLLAVLIAGALALCNALNSAQLAASHPVSGGTYEYGYVYLAPGFGFAAGWLFLCAKAASAATAALGVAGYLVAVFALEERVHVPLALAGVAAITVLVLSGIRRSATVNTVVVGVTLIALGAFVGALLPTALANAPERFAQFWPVTDAEAGTSDPVLVGGLVLHAAALVFVAFTGYGRLATLGEEVHEPEKTIPRAIWITLTVSLLIYVAVAFVAVALIGGAMYADVTERTAAPLEVIARMAEMRWLGKLLALGALTAMLGVLLNLVLGLSRMAVAMGRRRDLPAMLARLDRSERTPVWAVLFVAAGIVVLVLLGDIRLAWSFSAVSVLLYYAITNMAALALPREKRRYPAFVAVLGLFGCLALAAFVEWEYGAVALTVLLAGFLLRAVVRLTTRRNA